MASSSSSLSTRPQTLDVLIGDLIDQALNASYPELNESCDFDHLLQGERFDGDDYVCCNVLSICTKLRAKDRKSFSKKGSKHVAKTIVENFPKSAMIPEVSIRSGCFLTFKLSLEWMTKRIENMLEDGIGTWAPEYNLIKAAVTLFPGSGIGSDTYADGVRAHCIQQMLSHTLTFCGVDMYDEPVNKVLMTTQRLEEARRVVEKLFLIERGNFRKRSGGMSEPPLFVAAKTDEPWSITNEIAFQDFVNLWLVIHSHKLDTIIYLAPVRQLVYLEKFFEVVRDVQWLNNLRVSYRGYRTSQNEEEKLACLVRDFWNYSELTSLAELGEAAGYGSTKSVLHKDAVITSKRTCQVVFEFALIYAYLKNNTLSEIPLTIDELFNEKENTFVYLLHTQALVRSVIENPRRGTRKLTKALVAKEHELASHLVRFTEVVKEACSRTLPNILCEYLYDLSKIFTSCYGEVRPVETRLSLCRATSVVMEKCFHLFRISPTCSRYVDECPYKGIFKSEEVPKKAPTIVNPFIPWSGSDDARRCDSRVEIFSMYVSIYDDIKEGKLCGTITLKNNKTFEFVDVFSRPICQPMQIKNGSYILLGNTSSGTCEVALDSPTEIRTNLIVTSEKQDGRKDVYELSCGKGELDTLKFGQEKIRSKCDAKTFESASGLIQFHYVLVRDAIDLSFEVTFESPDTNGFLVQGHIIAFYADLDVDEAQKMFYNAHIFKTDGLRVLPGKKLELDKSVIAVPVNGELVFETALGDVRTGKMLVNKKIQYSFVTNEGSERLEMPLSDRRGKKGGSFTIALKWKKKGTFDYIVA